MPHGPCKGCENAEKRARRNPELAAQIAAGGETLAAFGTPLERESARALISTGSVEAAAELLQISPSALRAHLGELLRRGAQRGWSPGNDLKTPIPDGYHVKGVSTYYRHNEDGSVVAAGQWVKTDKDKQHQLETMLDALKVGLEPWRGWAPPVPLPTARDSDLLCVYPMGDPHIGMHAWAVETGQSFDLKIAEHNLCAAVDALAAGAPPAEQALIINLGDYYHADNSTNQTLRAHHALDVDSRWPKVLGVGIRIMRRCIDRALERHARVRLICEIGNHDDHSAIMLAVAMSQFYEREPRVEIDTSPAKFHWYEFGQNLIGVTHGDTCKMADLPMVMACDQREAWGRTRYRYGYTGHVHHDSAKEIGGVLVESFRTMAPGDAWARSKGYRAGQDMKLDVLHRDYGRITRHVVGIQQIPGGVVA